jgi:cell division septum initiation protein DivIVA
MTDRAEVSYWLRGIVPYLQRLPDYLDEIDEGEQRLEAIRDALSTQTAQLNKINAELADLEAQRVGKLQEVSTIGIEAEAHARTIIEAANAKASEIEKLAEEKAQQRKADADEYVREKMAVVERWRRELT